MGTMKKMARLSLWAAVACVCGSNVAYAQADPEAGDIEPAPSEGASHGSSFSAGGQVSTRPAHDTETPSSVRFRPPAEEHGDSSNADSGASGDDHEASVGSIGIGFFGVTTVPIMNCDTMTTTACGPTPDNDLSAPTIGVRYWLSDTLGIETAVGLRIASGTRFTVDTSQLAFAVHGGLPLALAHSRHLVFELVPQLNVGVSSGSFKTYNPMRTTDLSGMLFEAGAKVGAEVHFGFMGMPQLALQGTLGVMFRYEDRSATAPNNTGNGRTTVEQKQTTFATGVDGSPWDIFRSAITAIYYFY